MKRICVYCGSNRGAREAYLGAARRLAAVLVENDIELVYGGGAVGLMGLVADTVLEADVGVMLVCGILAYFM